MICSVKFDLFSGKNRKRSYFTLSLYLAPLFNSSNIKKREGFEALPFIGSVFKRLA